jgi:hypothetical protein
VKSDNAEDEDDRQSHDDDRVDLEAGRLIGVQPWNKTLAFVQMYGRLPRHGRRSYKQRRSGVRHICFPVLGSVEHLEGDLLSMVLELPPAPAALVLLGRWLETFSARSAAAFLRITVAGPPGGLGDAWRAVVVPVAALFTGEVGRGADCSRHVSCCVRGAGD